MILKHPLRHHFGQRHPEGCPGIITPLHGWQSVAVWLQLKAECFSNGTSTCRAVRVIKGHALLERGLEQVSAEYALRDDGGIRVLNRGVDAKSGEQKQAEGKAYFVNSPAEAHLKVSFFGPFYGSYVVYELDDNYQYAFVAGFNHDYLWLLSRTPEISPELKEHFVTKAKTLGFATEQLIWVKQ